MIIKSETRLISQAKPGYVTIVNTFDLREVLFQIFFTTQTAKKKWA
jgi:hypothetical protein